MCKIDTISNFPVPTITSQNQWIIYKIESFVDKILAIIKIDDYLQNSDKQSKIQEYEKQIDKMVYQLYGLTEDEIKIVEGNVK